MQILGRLYKKVIKVNYFVPKLVNQNREFES